MKQRLGIGLLLAGVVLVYGNTLWNSFTQDDGFYVLQNPQVTDLSIRELFKPHLISQVFRPLTFGTYALNWALQGPSPFGFHLVNLLLHAGVCVLLYLFLLRCLCASVLPEPKRNIVALAAAAIFAVHPIHSEAVASISGRAELLAAVFLLAACIFHFGNREIPALACFVLALLSKESAVVLLPLILVCDYARRDWKANGRYARIAGLTVLYTGILWKIQGGRFGQVGNESNMLDNPLAGLSATWRILNAIRVGWKYVGLQFYPRTLSCDYSFSQIPVYLDWRRTLPAAAAAAIALAAWMWSVRKRETGLLLAGGIYLTAFATTANIFTPIGTIMGERLAYLPSAGFCLLVALGLAWLGGDGEQSDGRRNLAFGLLCVILGALSVRTVVRNMDWKDNATLYSSAVNAVPMSAKMHAAMGTVYMDEEQNDLASVEFQAALKIYPDYLDAMETYGVLETRLGNYPVAGFMLEKAFYSSGRYNINYDFMLVNLAGLYMQTNHGDAALSLLNQEISQSPKYSRAWSSRAVIHYQHGEMTAARSDAQTALALDARNSQAQNVLELLNTATASANSK